MGALKKRNGSMGGGVVVEVAPPPPQTFGEKRGIDPALPGPSERVEKPRGLVLAHLL